jgi:hypothetical protein
MVCLPEASGFMEARGGMSVLGVPGYVNLGWLSGIVKLGHVGLENANVSDVDQRPCPSPRERPAEHMFVSPAEYLLKGLPMGFVSVYAKLPVVRKPSSPLVVLIVQPVS